MGKKILKAKTYIAILLISVGVFTFLRSHYRVFNVDEVVYGFVLDAKEYGDYYNGSLNKKLTTFEEVVSSQINHYNFQNGRSIVHAIEQIFTGIIGVEWYYAINAVLFVALIVSIVRFSTDKGSRSNLFIWLFTVGSLVYLFPQPDYLWYSINMSVNYLIPSLLMIVVLISIKRVDSGTDLTIGSGIAISFVSFLFGWSHEAFSIPFGGAILIYYLFHHKLFFNKGWIIALPLWVGTLIMISAPGYWMRLSHYTTSGGSNFIQRLSYIVEILRELYPLWILLLSSIIFKNEGICRFKTFFCRNYVMSLSVILGFALLLILCPPIRGYTAIDILCLCLTIKILSVGKFFQHNTNITYTVSGILILIFILHQTEIVRNQIKAHDIQLKLVNDYKNSEDGIVSYSPPVLSPLSRHHVTQWPLLPNFNDTYFIMANCLSLEKKMKVYNPVEYDVLKAQSGYIDSLPTVPGNSPFVSVGENRYWVEADALPTSGRIELEYYPVDFSYDVELLLKIKFALFPDSYPAREIVEPFDTIFTQSHTYYRIIPSGVRKIKSINIIK